VNLAKSSRMYARLSFTDGDVVVAPRDRDLFLISAEKATEACRETIQAEQRVKQFEEQLLTPLNEWCQRHQDKLKACYVPLPERYIRIFCVTKSKAFDFEFAEKIAGLEVELASAGWRVNTFQLPEADEESLGTFFNPIGALEVYAEG
jgi:hypothetical protein